MCFSGRACRHGQSAAQTCRCQNPRAVLFRKLWSCCVCAGTAPTDFILRCCPPGSCGLRLCVHCACLPAGSCSMHFVFFPIFFGRLREIHISDHTGSSLAPSAGCSPCARSGVAKFAAGDRIITRLASFPQFTVWSGL